MQVIIMAGGQGSRLGILTSSTPKALLPVGNGTLLSNLLDSLSSNGMSEAVLCIGPPNRRRIFHEVIGEGWHGIPVRHVAEEQPLGTAGCLSLIEELQPTFMVVNCDIVTELRFSEMLHQHIAEGAAATVATGTWIERLRFGAVQCAGDGRVITLEEKPEIRQEILLGVYVMNRQELAPVLPRPAMRLDMPELLSAMIHQGQKVRRFHSDAPWQDIGTRVDYERLCNEETP